MMAGLFSPPFAAAVVAVCMATFFAVSISNTLWGSKKRRGTEHRAEMNPPNERETQVVLVVVSTFLLFVFSGSYIVLGLLGWENSPPVGLLQIPQPEVVRAFGIVFFVAGSALFIWSVLARGRYSVSWSMPVDQKLVTWGPYRYVRHPSYTGYFLMFIGLFLIWFNLLAAVPLLGIIGYVKMSYREEKMLVLRFGDAYLEYQKNTGRFLPRL